MGFFGRLFGRKQSEGMRSQMLAPQEVMLNTDEPWRAFCPGPTSDVYPLQVGANNDLAFARIRSGDFTLRKIKDSESVSLNTFSSGFLLFATAWEPYSAIAIGNIKKQIEDGYENNRWGIVLIDESDETISEQMDDQWYKDVVYVLGRDSKSMIPQIGGIPFRVNVNDDGSVRDISEGVYCTQNLIDKTA